MADYSRYLIVEDPLVVLPTIARVLDINKAIILQQVQYWLKKSKHERDGYRWVWNSYREWSEQFTWLTPRAIRHHIKELETLGLLIAGEYNRDTRDKTKWYRIDYAAIDELVTKSSHGLSSGGTPPAADGSMQAPPAVVALPETPTKTTPEITLDDRPEEFTEYESNIGMLTPVIAQNLLEAIKHYPKGWVSDAIKVAAENNARSWRYIEKVLENWQAHGKNTGPPGNRPVPFRGDKTDKRSDDPDKYIQGKYGHMVNR